MFRRLLFALVPVLAALLSLGAVGAYAASAAPGSGHPNPALQTTWPQGVGGHVRAGGAPPPCGLGTDPLYNIGQTWWAQDAGAGQIIVLSNGSCYQQIDGQTAGGYTWWQIEDSASRCINIGTNDYAYSNSCPLHDSTEQFAIISDGSGGFYLWNRHTSDYLAGCGNGPGGLVYVTANISDGCAANVGTATDWDNA